MPKLAFYCNILDDYHYWNIFQFTFFNIYFTLPSNMNFIWSESPHYRMSIWIAGGGISGLSFALKASRISSKSIRIYEKDSNLGGWIQTVRTNSGKGSFFLEISCLYRGVQVWMKHLLWWGPDMSVTFFKMGSQYECNTSSVKVWV